MKFGIGIIGAGNWANHWIPAIRDSEILEPIGVSVGSKAEIFASKFNLKYYENPHQLFSDKNIQIVCILTQHHVHTEYAVMAIEYGKHVIVEKPMAVSVEECDKMIEAAKKYKVKLQVAHSRRFFPIIRKAKQILDSGELGKVLMMRHVFAHPWRPPYKIGETIDWRSDPEKGKNFFLGYGCHHIDYIHYLINSRCKKLYAKMRGFWTDIDTINAGMIFLDFENGAFSTYWELDTVAPTIKEYPPFPDFRENNEIVCEKGLMILEPYRRLLIRKNGGWETILELPREKADPIRKFLREELEMLAYAIETDSDPPCTGEDGRHTVEICLSAIESSKKDKIIELKTSPKLHKNCRPLYYDT